MGCRDKPGNDGDWGRLESVARNVAKPVAKNVVSIFSVAKANKISDLWRDFAVTPA
jgi:hypothetical protein